MIATDITHRQTLVLPDDLAHYRLPDPIDPDAFAIADAVPMSMSIPYFFQPVELTDAADGSSSVIVDGGVVSNVPVWIFDTETTPPKRPTFGFHLAGGRGVGGGLQRVVSGLGGAAEMGVEIVHTATDARDTRFESHSSVVRTCTVSAGEVGTTDFDLTQAQKPQLRASGREGAPRFLDGFERSRYRNTYGRTLAGS